MTKHFLSSNLPKKTVSVFVVLSFLIGQSLFGSEVFASVPQQDCLAVPNTSDDIVPDQSAAVREEIIHYLEPGAFGKGSPLQALVKHNLPVSSSAEKINAAREMLAEATDIAIHKVFENGDRVAESYRRVLAMALDNLIDLESRIEKDTYIFDAVVTGPNDYLFDFNLLPYETCYGFSFEIVDYLYRRSPERLAEYVFRKSLPEHYREKNQAADVAGQNSDIEEDKRLYYEKMCNVVLVDIFGLNEGAGFRSDLHGFYESIMSGTKENGQVWLTPDEATGYLNDLPNIGSFEKLKKFYHMAEKEKISYTEFLSQLAPELGVMADILSRTKPHDELNALLEKGQNITIEQLDILRSAGEFALQFMAEKQGVDNKERLKQIKETFVKYPELSKYFISYFETKFDPEKDLNARGEAAGAIRDEMVKLMDQAGINSEDMQVFYTTLAMMVSTVRTNYYVPKRTELTFRIEPRTLVLVDRSKALIRTPPTAIIWVHVPYGVYGAHSRYSNVARGGLRFLRPERTQLRNKVLSECVALSFTQHKKHMDIPEGGSKGAFICEEGLNPVAASVGYVDGLIECMMPNKRIVVGAGASAVDPLELGPDEGTAELANLITVRAWMLGLSDWRLLMTGKADVLFGVSHMKNDLLDPPESGNRVTSQGVITHAVEMARYLRDKGVITSKENEPIFFSMTGGLDGDVGSGNVERLMHHYGENARIRSLVDISGVMFDPEGLDHQALYEMYNKGMRAASFPKEKLHEGGFVARAVSGPAEDNYIELGEASLKYMNARALDPKTLEELGIDKIYKKQAGLKEDEPLITVLERGVNGVPVRIKVHGVFLRDALFFLTKADMLVPGGGVKDAINEKNWKLFIDENDSPVTKSIVYGANVFMEKSAGDNLEKLGVVIEPDEKANSVGVEISSRQEIDSNLLFRESELTIDIKKEYFRQVLAKCIANAKEKFWALRIEAEKQPDVPVVTGISSKMSAEVIRLTESILNSPLVGERKGDYSPKVLSYLKEYFPDLSQVDKGYSTTIDRVFDRMPSDRIKAIVAKMIAKDVVMYLGIDGIAEACSRAKAEELKVIEVFLEYAHVNGLHKKTKEIVDNKEGLSPSEQMSKLRAVREETMNRVYALFSDKGESDIIKYGRDAETERVINGIIKDVPLRARIFLVHLARVTKNSDTYHYLGIETGSDSHREAVLSSTVYKALKKLQDARDENGELMFPKLIVEIGTSDVLVRNIGERMDKGELSSEQVFISALRSSVEHAAFKSIEGSAWIAAIDDSTGMNYIPVVEAAIINMMAYRGAGLAQIKKIYDSISKEPKTIQELEDMITKRVISIIPKSVPINYDVMRDICDLMAKQIDSAA